MTPLTSDEMEGKSFSATEIHAPGSGTEILHPTRESTQTLKAQAVAEFWSDPKTVKEGIPFHMP